MTSVAAFLLGPSFGLVLLSHAEYAIKHPCVVWETSTLVLDHVLAPVRKRPNQHTIFSNRRREVDTPFVD